MIRQDVLICKTQTPLGEFLSPIFEQVDRLRRRVLPQATRGILFSGSLVGVELRRWGRDDGPDRFHQARRMPAKCDAGVVGDS